MDIYGNKLVNTIETLPLWISLSNLADVLTMVRGCATRCGGDIVTLLWFRASVRAWFRPSEDLVNTIETKPLHISLSNLADMFTMMRG